MESPTISKYLSVNVDPGPVALDAETDESVHGILNSFSVWSSFSLSRASEQGEHIKTQIIKPFKNIKITDLLRTVSRFIHFQT